MLQLGLGQGRHSRRAAGVDALLQKPLVLPFLLPQLFQPLLDLGVVRPLKQVQP